MSRSSSAASLARTDSAKSFSSCGTASERASSNRNSLVILVDAGLSAARPLKLSHVTQRAARGGSWSLLQASRLAFEAPLSRSPGEFTPPNSPIADAPKHGPSWQQVGLTIANCLVGAGCLGLPYALRQAGWIGLVIILLATMTTCCTAKMLVDSIETLNRRHVACSTYDDLVENCFGAWGSILMRVFTCLELYGGIICMIVLHAVNWPALLSLPPTPLQGFTSIAADFGSFSAAGLDLASMDARTLVTACVCALALPTLLVQTRHLAAFATVGLAATLMVAGVTLAAPLMGDAPLPLPDGTACPVLADATQGTGAGGAGSRALGQLEEEPHVSVMGHQLLRAEGIGVATGLALFAFAGHATFPEMWRQMTQEDRPHFGKACHLGFGLAAAFYTALAALGYYFFGECAADSLTLNLLDVSPSLGGLATGGVLLSTFTSISVLSVPVVRICREAVAFGDKATITYLRQREALAFGLWQPADAATLAIKGTMMGLAGAVALAVPNFGFVVALIGAFTCMLISLLLPTFCNLAVHGRELSPSSLLLHAAIMVTGGIGMVVGVRSTLEAGA